MTKRDMKTLEGVREFRDGNIKEWEEVLFHLDRTLMSARDKKVVPIYLTKGRIKQAESAFLKFKRKERDNPEGITDWIGFRVLCLFQQDLDETFDFLLDLLLNLKNQNISNGPINHFELKEVIAFNWPPERGSELLRRMKKKLECCSSTTERAHPAGIDVAYTHYDGDHKHHVISFEFREITKGSGYQSVHFVATAQLGSSKGVKCEIQLRTLLQDVWGELEHALSYKKGKIHPHISNSFFLLSKELEAKDSLLRQLRDLRDQETALVRFSTIRSGPSGWLNYPSKFLAKAFADTDTECVKKFKVYSSLCARRKGHPDRMEWQAQTRNLLDEIERLRPNSKNEHFDYLVSMENGYLAYSAGDLKEAGRRYQEVIGSSLGKEQWFPYFRRGELCLAGDKIEDALVAFDQCESLMKDVNENPKDCYLARVGLAYSYWSLGPEFLEIAVKKMEEGCKFIKEVLKMDDLPPDERMRLEFSIANNLGYYYLEQWLATPQDADVRKLHERKQLAEEYFEQLKALVERSGKEHCSSNAFDTLAWYCYSAAQRTQDLDERGRLMEQAQQYIEEGEHYANRAPSRLISTSIQREHIKLILVGSKQMNDQLLGDSRSDSAVQ